MAVIICGMNGSGKSTLGRALAEHLGWRFLDNEDLYFPKTDPVRPFAGERTQDEVKQLLLEALRQDEQLIFASVRGNYDDAALPYYKAAVLVEVPREIRLARVKERSFRKFGERMLPGGDMYESEQRFFDIVAARPEDYATRWLNGLDIPVLRVDGTRPVGENITIIADWRKGLHV